ncbi:hypothetical protein CAP48_00340 [Advenella sp. S44]|uniref:alcohol dehydrogenase n=1 Tax=Advenella sp. S44 TaxID=1982755 RepID=UPI000C2B1794|nr:alcohol dehydrogenase [Advenella sp. S44]PJX27683.1 hypothetical protein CAP48_00340 [Advenella sp. S44]
MRAYVVQCFCKPINLCDYTDPVPSGTEVVINVQRCGVCHTDLHLQDGYYDVGGGKRLNLVDRGIKPPLVLGHEIVGRLSAKGPDAPISDVEIGKSFLVFPWLGCGHCDDCNSGHENLCAKPNSIGVARPGGYAEQCVIPHPKYLVDIDGIDPSLAATYACSGLTAFSALRKVQIDKEKDLLLLFGLGGVGMAGLQLAMTMGFKRIAVADIDDAKRQYALDAGAMLALDPRDDSATNQLLLTAGGVAASVDFVGTTTTSQLAVASLRKGGTAVIVGLFGGDITLQLPPLVQRSITLRGSYVGTLQELKDLINLIKSGTVRPLPVEEVAFEHLNATLERLREGNVQGRAVLRV